MIFNQRKKLLIEPEFQLSFLRFTGIILVINSIIYYLSSYLFFRDIKEIGLELGFKKDHVFFDFLQIQESKMNLVLCISFLITGIVFMAWGLLISNKIAGPIYRLKLELKRRLDDKNEKSAIRFRDGDYFHDVASLVSKFINR